MDLLCLFLIGVEVAFGAGLKMKEVSPRLDLSKKVFWSEAKEENILLCVNKPVLKPLTRNEGILQEGHIHVRLLFKQ